MFTTFFTLSYGKIMYQTLLLLNFYNITQINESGNQFTIQQCVIDQSVTYGSTDHLLFAIPSMVICLVFNILPSLLLIIYLIGAF